MCVSIPQQGFNKDHMLHGQKPKHRNTAIENKPPAYLNNPASKRLIWTAALCMISNKGLIHSKKAQKSSNQNPTKKQNKLNFCKNMLNKTKFHQFFCTQYSFFTSTIFFHNFSYLAFLTSDCRKIFMQCTPNAQHQK